MTNLTNKLFLSVFMLLLSISPAAAHNDTFFNSPHRLELKPASFAEPGYQLAKSYWLGGAEITLNFKGDDDDTICQAKGYITGACKGNETPIKYCGAGNKYHLCGCDASVYRYSVSNCVSGSLPNDDICGDYSSGCVCEGAFVWNSDSNSCDFYCSSNYDCPGQVCRTSSGDCVDCVYDSDCGSGQVCTDNKCETADLCANVNCTGGQTCNASTGECECPSGQVLSDGQCEQADCSNGGIICSGSTPVCAENGQCVECVSASDCGANEICSGNSCQTVDRCKDVSCSGGKSCNPNNGQCECPSDKPYESGGICEAPNCANGGVTCPPGQTCNKTSKLCENQQEYCITGSIFYSDATCSSTYKTDKTPIGVVVDPERHLVVGLQSTIGSISDTPDYSLNFTNVGNEDTDEVYSERGYENTKEIYNQTRDIGGSVVSFCWENTTMALKGGRWYVPATMEVKLLEENFSKINETLSVLSQYIDAFPLASDHIWTSDESKAIYNIVGMRAYQLPSGEIADGMPKSTSVNVRCVGRYETDPFYGDTINPVAIGQNGGYSSYPFTFCPESYFLEKFYWNDKYNRCVFDQGAQGGGQGGNELPSCEEWEEAGWQDAGSTYNANLCRSYNEEIKECQYANGSKGKFCDLSTNCQVGADAYYTYKYCPNGAQCMYRSCTYYKTLPASSGYLKQIGKKKCFACWGFTNESCGSMSHFVQCK